ncbi:MAG: penicillin-binding protein, 1A family, nonfunctional [Candidatus Daviesbacteria bacterium GW2011_GWA1_41_61]|uniref:Penicillin-binding protein, 1A family, nonfunctional n=1 Tax=Candidatus Daviesbacteria bacterium GW2011_GWA2_40_9 TaxID=1618424 RepID=A0A0G0U8V2_9BACT|nr:MAG: penicillin-binding protein, 1A family, nonfunctional [Candidatus Daviesbacteria bacterium GW2011_GWC1_40_9]KKR83666.1 MAG: penicillin-binding protein, 1A family, nonfunctional [Candidatus Daviesbacteria bacterium GW2011_GWA2_40_9]KKR92675.1 MAG: penicillin-binding protein, 1A family, nonfunctional [Candidatus Daviesbacteria bacterium GW2011_GWB1_41_15]KKS14606.1 MAG: penicillin-binding protein, 1A family, nonfunctional [Candidatus Daviesbacteria bacterium GW2011_GWA1_41_61]
MKLSLNSPPKNKKQSKRKNSRLNLKRKFLAIFLALTLFLSLVPIITYATYIPDLDSKEEIMNKSSTGVVLFDRNNQPFFTFYQGRERQAVPLDEISPYLQMATVASEDKEFYSHYGFSPKAIVRALITDIKRGNFASGGSTITQQLVKNALLSPDKSITRKIQEILLAQELERRYNKNEILEMYLNSVYFGEGAFGVEEAAGRYFDKKSPDLNLAEAALLVGLLPAPSKLSPLSNDLTEIKKRQELILQKMMEQKMISDEDRLKAEKETLKFKPKANDLNTTGVHFAIMVKDELIAHYGEDKVSRSGFKVKTTLDLNFQTQAEQVVKQQLKILAPNNVSNAAIVVEDPKTGEIKALVGSKDWGAEGFGKVNVAVMPRQPGSSFKPIVYAAALEEKVITPATILWDQPTTFATNYRPKNYDGKFRGPVTARRALANSLNVPSVEVLSKLGVSSAVEMAQRVGITTIEDPQRYGLSLVLGAGEVKLLDITNAYATFANMGLKNDPSFILEIKDKYDQVIYTHQAKPKKVLNSEVAFLISSILSDSGARAEIFGTVLNISRKVAVKTGTSESYRDSLTIGYTPSLAIGVWVGNNDGRPMNSVAGSLGAAPIWKQLMEKFLQGTPKEQFIQPEGIVTYTCRREYFIKGTEPTAGCASSTPSPTVTISPTPPQEGKKSALNQPFLLLLGRNFNLTKAAFLCYDDYAQQDHVPAGTWQGKVDGSLSEEPNLLGTFENLGNIFLHRWCTTG